MNKRVFCSQIVCVVILVLLNCTENEGARILAVIPIPSISHQVVFRPLFQELAKRGHEMTIVTTDPAFEEGNTPDNMTEIDLHDISYKHWKEDLLESSDRKEFDQLGDFKLLLKAYNIIFESQIKTKKVHDILKKPKDYYDLIFMESIFRQYLVLTHVFQAPLIMITSLGGAIFDNYEVIGAPTHPILNPYIMRQRFYNLTFWEKFHELYFHYSMKYLYYDHIETDDVVLRKLFGSDVPSLGELSNNVDMFFINSHSILDGNQPVPSSVVRFYGLHKKPEKELPNDLKNYLDSSTNGVIYMSFGTNVDPSLLSQEKIQLFVKVFTKLPYNVLWKWNRDDVPSNHSNIKFGKWFPQSDLLKHPKIKLFITQGGLQSTEESINAGVPLIGIPLIGDQWFNTEKYKVFGIGKQLDLNALDEDVLKSTIDEVIGDKSYRKKIEKLRLLLADQQETPLERTIWWTEYVIRHKGAKHLRSPYANISWWDYLELDFVFKLLALVTTVLSVLTVILYYLYRFVVNIFRRFNKLKTK